MSKNQNHKDMKPDIKEIERYKNEIIKMAENDLYHKDSPELQIDTLSNIVGALLDSNKDGENDQLIAFFTHIGRSLKELIKYRTLNNQNDGKS